MLTSNEYVKIMEEKERKEDEEAELKKSDNLSGRGSDKRKKP